MTTETSRLYGDRLKKITSINDVKVAQHVLWWRGYYYHHAIVTSVDTIRNEITVIHFTGDPRAKLSSASASMITLFILICLIRKSNF